MNNLNIVKVKFKFIFLLIIILSSYLLIAQTKNDYWWYSTSENLLYNPGGFLLLRLGLVYQFQNGKL